jgi:hypothetical protein
VNRNIYFYNNIWSDFTGTMGEDLDGGRGEFSDGDPMETKNLVFDNNLYWNAGYQIPAGEVVSPIPDDIRRFIANPLMNVDQSNVILPHWDGNAFPSGKFAIRDEFIRLVRDYGAISIFSPAKNNADPAFAPGEDILGRPRRWSPDLGAYENQIDFILMPLFFIK